MAYRATKYSSTVLTPITMRFGRVVTEPIELVAGLSPDDSSVSSLPDYVLKLRQRLKLSHQPAQEALGKAFERVKRQYDKNFCQNPYRVVGRLDDLVYHIQKEPRSKIKVLHHNKLLVYYARIPLDNSWFSRRLTQTPLEVSASDEDASTDVGPMCKCWSPHETDIESADSSLPVSLHTSSSLACPTQCQQDEIGILRLAQRGRRHQPLIINPGFRPRRSRRAQDMFGDWISH
ncbi:hypothetical protein CRENBAI_007747 [Crenichthys baileyi]|uniref:Integrase p58-like C-terminal domain-containing protein n=1 Tax=Crenichthys baileyi TaxID=28760 RepID=A0AAV9RLR5_9TELE